MKATENILFQEKSSDPADFIFEISNPACQKNIFRSTGQALRRQQVARLEANIKLLRRKQEEFNRKMEEYIQNIRGLIACLERSMTVESREVAPAAEPAATGGTQVRCPTCGQERLFGNLMVVVARDSLESVNPSAELIVNEGGKIKKGTFLCPRCGNQNLLIRKASISPTHSPPAAPSASP